MADGEAEQLEAKPSAGDNKRGATERLPNGREEVAEGELHGCGEDQPRTGE
jgi:hypothetical protein